MKNGKVYGIIYIPESFSRDITKGVQTHVTIYCDMSGMLYYKAMLTANTNASLVMNKQIKIERSGNTTIRQDEVSTSPIAYEDISISIRRTVCQLPDTRRTDTDYPTNFTARSRSICRNCS